jgi:uncharacterized protein YdeI (YjbR/CyaY-like superfamily)
MDIGKTVYCADRKGWHDWLKANHDREKEIWLINPSLKSGEARILYNDAVEEALSFGWIDSQVKRVDENSTAQRFSPRNPFTKYSQPNKERLKKLLAENRIDQSIKTSVEKALKEEFMFPPDILKAIKANKEAWTNYRNFSPAYQRIRIAYIEGARTRPEEFKKRLANFIRTAEQNKIIGYGGIEKYY